MFDLMTLARQLRPPQLDAYIEAGGKVVGYACLATPRELFDAVGVLPYRIRALGNAERERADAHLSRFNCSFCRSCLQLGLDGTFDFFDGLIETNGCDHLRGMFENWQNARPRGFFHYLRVPHLINEQTLEVFAEELELLRRALADRYQRETSDRALRSVFERQNRVQGKLCRMRAMRERERPGVSGAEALAVALLESTLPPSVFEEQLDRLLRERESGPGLEGFRARILLAGSATDEIDLVEAIETLGGLIVADGLCYSSRIIRMPLPLEHEPMSALAESYLNDLLCPRMFDDYATRLKHTIGSARRATVDGAILVHNQFCDLHGVEVVRLRIDLEKEGIPCLVLEKEYGAASDLGRITTRVQAFLERIGR
jgi:benzoyl-CoA reductase/2-hydroxyglutaryl-CoA dehydratase subunit BcrC/BadD/HgdB